MYLIKSFTLGNSTNTVLNFDLFVREKEPILVESALASDGTRVVRAYDGKEEIFERLWTLDLLCDGVTEVRGIIRSLKQCLIDHLYGGK